MASDPWRQLTDLTMSKLLTVIEIIRGHDSEIPAQTIAVFLYIASHDDCSKKQLSDPEVGLNMSSASVSRNCDWLSGRHRLNKEGLGWIIKYRDPTDQRKQIYKLNEEGKALVRTIKRVLYEKTDSDLG